MFRVHMRKGLSGAGAKQGADPDKDDVSNLMEMALCGDPKVGDRSILPLIETAGGNSLN